MNFEEIKRILDSESGKSLREYLLRKLNELKSIENISEKDGSVAQMLELKAQKRAYYKLREILADILTFSQEVPKKDKRDSYLIE